MSARPGRGLCLTEGISKMAESTRWPRALASRSTRFKNSSSTFADFRCSDARSLVMSSIRARRSDESRVPRSGDHDFAASSFSANQLALGLPVALSRVSVPSIASPSVMGGAS